MSNAVYRVLVVDDSPFMRHMVRKMLEPEPDLTVVGEAADGEAGLARVRALRPDVITLDVEMPRLDGLSMLSRLMDERPTPVVMLSTLTQEGASATLEALELGAVDFVPKPGSGERSEVLALRAELVRAVRGAATSRVRKPQPSRPRPVAATAGGREAPVTRPAQGASFDRLVVLGSSTGGPPALGEVFSRLPAELGAPVLVVQHMPAGFTESMAKRLDRLSDLPVQEATHGETLRPNHAYVAPGSRQLALGKGATVAVSDAPPVHGVRPAVDFMLASIPAALARRSVVAILTGMGRDGAHGAAQIRAAGGRVVTQDEETCVIYGMPRGVIEEGGADVVVPIEGVANAIVQQLRQVAAPERKSA